MSKFDYVKDWLRYILLLMIGFIVCAFIVITAHKLDDKREKNYCYEIYATDNVILKKCQKYFDKEVKDNE